MNEYFRNPPIWKILQAVPLLQWRRCHDCDYISLYRDNMLPACACQVCGSPDTRVMVEANRLLHYQEESHVS